MATTKNKVVNEEKVEKKETNTSSDMKEILAFMESMKKEMDQLRKENESLKDVNAMNRKEISNVKSLHPWRKTNSLFFKEEILTLLKRGNFYFAPTHKNISLEKLFNLL